MPCTDPRVRFWTSVPGGSRLEVCVAPVDPTTGDDFYCSARFDANGVSEKWPHDRLVACKRKSLTAGSRFIVSVKVAFIRAGAVQIKAKIIHPDGTIHARPYCRQVNGAKDAIERASLAIKTLPAEDD